MSKVETILEEIKGLTLLEASDLVKKMEETFGVSAAAATVVAGEVTYRDGEATEALPGRLLRGAQAAPIAAAAE